MVRPAYLGGFSCAIMVIMNGGSVSGQLPRAIDLSSDVGERPGRDGLAADGELLSVITSANVACGGHAGDTESMRALCEIAAAKGVSVGAQVSFVDRESFGRRHLEVPLAQLTEQVAAQWDALAQSAQLAGTTVHYLRPHGALYNAALTDHRVAEAVVAAAPSGTPVLCLRGTALAEVAAASGRPVVAEIFADRAITDDGLLVSRAQPGAVIVDPVTIVARLRTWLATGAMRSINGNVVAVPAQSVCVHSDTPGALEAVRRLRTALERDGAHIAPFTLLPSSPGNPEPGEPEATGEGVRGD